MSRTTTYRVAETVHLTALGLWAGALLGAGLTAAVTFPTMRELDPSLGAFPGYTGEHWMLAAGRIAGSVFVATDIVQFVCAVLAVTGFAVAAYASVRRRSWLWFFRAVAMGVAFLLVSYHLLILAPTMDADLNAYWQAAARGDNTAAEEHRSAFSARHPAASRSIGLTAAAALSALALGAWTISSSGTSYGNPA